MQKKPSILQIVHDFPPHSYAGTELHAYNLSKHLKKKGYPIDIFVPYFDETKTPYEMTATAFEDLTLLHAILHPITNAVDKFYNPQMAHFFDVLFQYKRYDILHIHHLDMVSANVIHIAQKHAIPTVVKVDDFWWICATYHLVTTTEQQCTGPNSPTSPRNDIDKCAACLLNNDFKDPMRVGNTYYYLGMRRTYLQQTFPLATAVHFASHYAHELFIRSGFHNPRATVIHTGIQPITPHPKIHSDKIRFGYISAIARRKGLDIALTAFSANPLQNSELHIYGNVVEPNYFESLHPLIKKSANIHYHGGYTPSDLPRILSKVDVAVIPSRGENYPFVIREVLSAGIPVIASKITGIPEIIDHGKNGFLLDMGDPIHLAQLMVEIDHSPERLAALDPSSRKIKSTEDEFHEIEALYHAVK